MKQIFTFDSFDTIPEEGSLAYGLIVRVLGL